MPGRPRILLVDDDPDALLLLRYHLQDDFEVVATAETGEEAVALARGHSPDVVLMDFDLPGITGIEAIERILIHDPMAATVVVSAHQDLELLREAMAVGARDWVRKPFDPRQLIETVSRIAAEVGAKRRLLANNPNAPPNSGIWVFNTCCGGAGQTTLAIGIANELLTLGKGVLLVDLDLAFGNVAFNLGIFGGPDHLGTLLDDDVRVPKRFAMHLAEHPSGLRILTPPPELLAAHGLRPERIIEAVLAAAMHFDYVLVDLGTGIRDGFLPLLDEARLLFLPAPCHTAAMFKLRRYVRLLDQLEFPAEKVRPLLIGEEPGSESVEDFRRILEKVDSSIQQVFPYDRASCEGAILAGQPVTRHYPESPYSQAVRQFLVPILDLPKPPRPPGRQSIITRFLGSLSAPPRRRQDD